MTADGQAEEPWDCLLLGTGLSESILSAALSKAGLRVLHLDDAPVYGRHLAALSLDQLLSRGRAPLVPLEITRVA